MPGLSKVVCTAAPSPSDPRCFLRRINSCRAATAVGGGGAELALVLQPLNQSVSLSLLFLLSRLRRALRCFSSVFALLLPRIVLRRDTKMEKSEAAEAAGKSKTGRSKRRRVMVDVEKTATTRLATTMMAIFRVAF